MDGYVLNIPAVLERNEQAHLYSRKLIRPDLMHWQSDGEMAGKLFMSYMELISCGKLTYQRKAANRSAGV